MVKNEREDHAGTIADDERALELDPGNVGTHVIIGIFKQVQGNFTGKSVATGEKDCAGYLLARAELARLDGAQK